MDCIRRLFGFSKSKSEQKREREKNVEKSTNRSTSNAKSVEAGKELKEETSWSSIDAYIRRLFGFWDRKSPQKRKREEKFQDGPLQNPESERACKKKRLDKETNPFSVESIRCRICWDVVSCPVMTSLPCAHVFHENCLFQWLERSHVCPLCKWPTTVDTNDALLFMDLSRLWETSENNEDGTHGNEYQLESYESSSDNEGNESVTAGPSGEYPSVRSSSESPKVGSSSESPQVGSSSESPQVGSSSESRLNRSSILSPLTDSGNDITPPAGLSYHIPPVGSSSKFPPSRSSVQSPRTNAVMIMDPSRLWKNNENRIYENEFHPENHESTSSKLNDESPSAGQSGESLMAGLSNEPLQVGLSGQSPPDGWSDPSPPDGLSGLSPPDGLSDQSLPDGLSGQSPPDGLSGHSPPDGSSGQSPPDGSSGQSPPDIWSGQSLQNGLSGEYMPPGLSGQVSQTAVGMITDLSMLWKTSKTNEDGMNNNENQPESHKSTSSEAIDDYPLAESNVDSLL